MAKCAVWFNVYSQFSPHLSAVHKVANSDEKRLLLELAAGHVDTWKTPCPVTDRHLKQHAELSVSAQKEAIVRAKRRKVAQELRWLQSTQPAVPVVSWLASSLEKDREPDGPEAGRPCMCRPPLQARYRPQTGPALGPQQAGEQGEVHPGRIHTPLPEVEEGGREEEEEGEDQVVSCTTRRGAAGGPMPPEPLEPYDLQVYPFLDHFPTSHPEYGYGTFLLGCWGYIVRADF